MNGKQWGLGMLTMSLLCMTSCSISKQAVPNLIAQNTDEAKENAKKPQYVLSEFSLINGSNYLSAPVHLDYSGKDRWQSGSSGEYGYQKGYTSPVANNYVFVNRQDLTSQKLFPNNQFVILENQQIGESAIEVVGGDKKTVIKNVQALLYQVVKADTNNDKKLDGRDQKVIALTDVDGSNYRELITGIDRVLNIHAQSKDKRVVFYQIGQEYLAASIDIPSKSAKINKLSSIAK